MSNDKERGPRGDRGAIGPHGHQGDLGNQGRRGPTGERGAQGRPGVALEKPKSHMGKAYHFGMKRGFWALLAYLLLASTVAFGFYQQAQATEKAEQQSIDADFRTCTSGNILREQVRNLIIIATSQGGGDITKVAGFDKLDKATQEYLTNVASRSSGASSFREQGLKALADRDCERLFPDHSPKAVQDLKKP